MKKRSHHRRRRVHANPRKVHRRSRRRVHRNPSGFMAKRRRRGSKKAGMGSVVKEFLSMDGLFLIGGGVAGATVPTMILNKFAPNLTGYGRIAAKGALGIGGAWLLAKFANKKAGLGFGVTAVASAVSEAVNLIQLGKAIPAAPATLQDAIAQNPGLLSMAGANQLPPSGFSYLPSPFPLGPAQLSDGYRPGLGDGYRPGLGGWC